jgi:cell division protein FtsQ
MRALAESVDEQAPTSGRSGGFARHRKLILGAVSVVVLAALAVWLIAFSPVFGVRTVTVRGADGVAGQRVLAAADIAHGTPLLRLDTADVAHRVEGLPDIASASVTTSFPSTVTITVTARVAVGVVHSGNSYVLVDRTGDQFRTVRERPHHLPLFVVPKGTDARTTGGAVATVASALSADLRGRIRSIQGLDPSAITLLMNSGRVVRWGSAEQSAAKARILPALLHQAAVHHATQIDVTDPRLPFTR